MAESEDHKLLTIDQWNEWWKKDYERSKSKGSKGGDICEHGDEDNPFDQASPMLRKHIKSLLPNAIRKRIFLPLCGKSPDIKWLIDEGYEVVGLECSEHAILEFFEENSVEFEKSVSTKDHSFRVYTGKTANVVIYEGDYFKFNSDIAGGLFDAVWDSASLNTIELASRKPYVEIMRSVLDKQAKYMLSAMYFGEKRTWINNPFDITDADMTELFGEYFTWDKVDEDDSEWGLERIFLITFK
uniref:probable thiopurine S-methyltransferase n=1 Tax=Styela clava TaxID=7725 RepID=UPI001939F6A8|nr:probable thiopurine S-methyltransferase [Styela clava]